MKQKTHYEILFTPNGKNQRDAMWANSISDAKSRARKLFKEGATQIIIDSFKMEDGNDLSIGDVDDDSRKHYSLSADGKNFKQF